MEDGPISNFVRRITINQDYIIFKLRIDLKLLNICTYKIYYDTRILKSVNIYIYISTRRNYSIIN